MKCSLLTCILIIGFLSGNAQNSTHHFWTSKSEYIDYAKDPESCSDVTYDYYVNIEDDQNSELRATIVSSGDELELWSVSPSNHLFDWKWEVSRLTGANSPETSIKVGDTITHTFYKVTSMNSRLHETYLVTLYKENYEGELILYDQDYVYVLQERVGDQNTFSYNFDYDDITDYAEVDDLGHHRLTSYPNFSANATTRSDLGKIRERVDEKCVFPSYFSDSTAAGESSPRLGDGCLHIYNPNKNQTFILDSAEVDEACSDFQNYFTYDFCEDPCAFDAINIKAENHLEYKNSITSKSQINFYPNHSVNDIYYYAFSVKIPEDFDETRLKDQSNDALGTDRWHILAEFHQAHWPFDQDVFSSLCQAPVQLLYLGENKIALQYGLKDYNRCGFGPFEIEKGEWFDVIIHVKWSQVKEPSETWSADQGCLEFWLNSGEGYQKQCLIPATNFYRNHRDLGTKQANIAHFSRSSDFKTLLGPNLENFNPPFLSLKTMRGAALGGTQGFDFESHVFFDELRVGKSLSAVALEDTQILPDSLIDCGDIPYSTVMMQETTESDWQVLGFPNPSRIGYIDLSLNTSDEESAGHVEYFIYNMQGQIMSSGEIPPSRDSCRVDIDSWPKGMYILSSQYAGEVKTELLEVLH